MNWGCTVNHKVQIHDVTLDYQLPCLHLALLVDSSPWTLVRYKTLSYCQLSDSECVFEGIRC